MTDFILTKNIEINNAVYLETKIPIGISTLVFKDIKLTGQLDILTAKRRFKDNKKWNVVFENVLGKPEQPFIAYNLNSKHLLFRVISVYNNWITITLQNISDKHVYLQFCTRNDTIKTGDFTQYNSAPVCGNINSGIFKLANDDEIYIKGWE